MSKAYEFNQSKCITVQKARIKDLEKENEQLKKQLRDKECEWLRNNTVWEQMPSSRKSVTKTSLRLKPTKKGGCGVSKQDLNIKVRDDGVYILETENYRFHLDEKTHVEKMGRLINENEQLKQELAIYRKVASCSNCKYHNYDWYDDGDEFEVCDKRNDMSDRICKDWEEL